MIESIAELERLVIVLNEEINTEKAFLQSLLDHKNTTIAWFRERQDHDLSIIHEMIERVNTQYNEIVNTLDREIKMVEDRISMFDRGLDKRQ